LLPALRRLQIELVALAAGKRALLVTLVARRAVALPVVVEVRVRVNVRGLLREFLVRLVAREALRLADRFRGVAIHVAGLTLHAALDVAIREEVVSRSGSRGGARDQHGERHND